LPTIRYALAEDEKTYWFAHLHSIEAIVTSSFQDWAHDLLGFGFTELYWVPPLFFWARKILFSYY